MEAFLEQAWRHANIPAELANLRPLGDLVLVRVIPEPEMQGLIVLPQGTPGRENLAPRIGEVIAVGPGDRVIWLRCFGCDHKFSRSSENFCWDYGMKGIFRCPKCDRIQQIYEDRHPMHVKPGDRILYWRTYANEVVLNDELYQLIHEEQHVVAVLEYS